MHPDVAQLTQYPVLRPHKLNYFSYQTDSDPDKISMPYHAILYVSFARSGSFRIPSPNVVPPRRPKSEEVSLLNTSQEPSPTCVRYPFDEAYLVPVPYRPRKYFTYVDYVEYVVFLVPINIQHSKKTKGYGFVRWGLFYVKHFPLENGYLGIQLQN